MPRQSSAALSIVHIEPAKRRPDPSSNLSPRAAEQWREIVASMPADWFPRETHPMLTQLCRCIDRCQMVGEALDRVQAEGGDLSERAYQNLIRAEMQLSGTIAKLSTKMRISQQSSSNYDKKRKRTGKKAVPWETDAEEAS